MSGDSERVGNLSVWRVCESVEFSESLRDPQSLRVFESLSVRAFGQSGSLESLRVCRVLRVSNRVWQRLRVWESLEGLR